MDKKYFFILVTLILAAGLIRSRLLPDSTAPKSITIRSRNLEYRVETKAHRLQDLLSEQKVLDSESLKLYDPETDLQNGQVIYLAKKVQIEVNDGGEKTTYETREETVGDFLAMQKIPLAATDRVTPSLDNYLGDQMKITIDRIVDLEVTEKTPIAFKVVRRYDPASYYGRETVITAGANGELQKDFMVTYKNGVEIKRRLLHQAVLQSAVDQVVSFGSKIEVETVESGRASWYAYRGCMCAAHTSFPKGRYVRVTAVNSGKSIIVKINDYGPDRSIFPERVIDLDSVAYKELASLGSGTIEVRAELLKY